MADVAVDGLRVSYGTLSLHSFRQNALLKLLKHGLSCACCIAAGARRTRPLARRLPPAALTSRAARGVEYLPFVRTTRRQAACCP